MSLVDTSPFLTEIDPRAKVRGSRDALGLVPLWGHFGRHVVGNLTTVSTSPRGFTTLLLGYYFAREAQERDGAGPEVVLPNFIKFEQLVSYSRWGVNQDGDFRGIERVKRNLGEKGDLILSAEPRHQLLASQKTYGLWGLYSNPARSSGWIEEKEWALTRDARELVESRYLPFLAQAAGKNCSAIVDLLRGTRGRFDIDGRHRRLAEQIADLMVPGFDSAERQVYWDHLVKGGNRGSTGGLQPKFAQLLAESTGEDPAFDRAHLRALRKEAASRGEDYKALAERLDRIDRLETLLIPAASAFGFLLSRHGQTPRAVAAEIGKAWGDAFAKLDTQAFSDLSAEISEASSDESAGARWTAMAKALQAADHLRFIDLLLEQNALVMRLRHAGNPWARIEHGRLDIRFRDESPALVPKRDLATAWRSNYFLDPLKEMIVALRRPA